MLYLWEIRGIEMIENKVKKDLLNKIMKKIREEKANIEKANQIDKKYYNMNISIEKLLEISEELKEQDLKEKDEKDRLVIHNGNPYITYILAIKAIINEMNMKISVNEAMLGTNLILTKIISEVAEERKIKTNIEIKRSIEIEEIKQGKNFTIVVLGDSSQYRFLLRNGIKQVKYNARTNVAIYIENQQLEELKQNIIQYCADNLIEIEVYEAENVAEAINQIKADNQGERVMLLTKEKVDKEIIKEMPITVNENILRNFEKEFVKGEIG